MSSSLSAVVVAAGRSSRFQKSLPSSEIKSKLLLEWDGKPLFVHTLKALASLSLSEVSLVIRPEDEEIFHSLLKKHSPELKSLPPLKIVFGGARRQDSVRHGIEALVPSETLLIHDAARPFLSPAFLERLVRTSKNYDAVIPVTKVVETLKEIDSNGVVVKTHDRNRFVRVQTPQFFKYSLIQSVHEKCKDSNLEFTDDAAMLEHLGYEVQTCEGEAANIKVTVIEDLKAIYAR